MRQCRPKRGTIALGHSALIALNCNKEIPGVTDYEGSMGVPAGKCYHCHTGRCPVGITTQDPELVKRLPVEEATERVVNYINSMTMEIQMLARACGKNNVHDLEPEDLRALTLEASFITGIPVVGTNLAFGRPDLWPQPHGTPANGHSAYHAEAPEHTNGKSGKKKGKKHSQVK